MLIVHAVILGLIQGLTEFIPISSSGHLVIAQMFLSGASDHLFLEFVNIGTMLALFVFFRKKIAKILTDVFVRRNFRLARNILITAVPAGVVGFLLADFIGSEAFFSSALVVMWTLAVVGFVMVFSEKLPHASAVKDGEELSPLRAFVIGLAQMLALIPGVSRSGATILAARFSGLKPAEAAEYSFLASLPIMLGVTFKVLLTDFDYLAANVVPLVVSNIVAFAVGLLAVGFLMRYLAKRSLAVFGWYRIGLAVLLGFILLIQW